MSAVVPFFTCWSMARNVAALCVAILFVSAASAPSQSSADRLPSRVEEYVAAHVKLTPQERKTLGEGNPVTKLLDTDKSEEVAVFGAIWIGAPIRRYVDAVTDIENFERGGSFTVTKRISSPPRLEDFAQLRLSADDVQDLRSCRVGDCEVKFGEEALERFRKNVDWESAKARDQANAIAQQLALGYVTSYLEGGNERLAVYRDQSRPTFVAQEFRLMVDKMPELTVYMPEVRRYLLEYPKVTMPGFRSFLYWQETEFGLKPIIRINHVAVREGSEGAVVASKMLYASHYFWTGLELRALLPDSRRGPGFWFITVNRSRSDGLSGSAGFLIRTVVRGKVEEGLLEGLRKTKQVMEAAR
jgi:hypothetical protein